MYIYGIILTLAVVVLSDEMDSSDFDALIKDIFGVTCNLENGKFGSCVKRYECSVANDTDGINMLKPQHYRGSCQDPTHVCCSLENKFNALNNQVQPKKIGCGWRNRNGLGIQPTNLTQSETKFGEFPWTAVVLRKEESETMKNTHQNTYVGGASIIHPSIVLTAAHMVSGLGLFIRAGEWDTRSNNELYSYQDRQIKEIVLHEDFNKRNLFNDIALVFLTQPLEIENNVGIVCLPLPNVPVAEGIRCISSGWGKDKPSRKNSYHHIMKKVEVPTLNREQCQSQLRLTRLGRFFELHRSFMCAGGEEDVDTCEGDGGSPLVCPLGNDRYIQSGIVAWGIDCGLKNTPAAYTNVTNFRSWVDEKVIERGYDPSSYTY